MVTPNLKRLCLAGLVAILGLLAAPAASAQLSVGARFPSLATFNLVGTPPETKGSVVLVDFWASWCAPCKASFPAYTQLQAQYAGKGLIILGVSVDESPSAYATFIAKNKPGFATVSDRSHALVEAVQVPTMPTSYLVDRNGTIRFVHAGFHAGETERELRHELDALLDEKAP